MLRCLHYPWYNSVLGTVRAASGNTIALTISPLDLNAIQGDRNLATNENNTFLSITSLAIRDFAGLNVNSGTSRVTNFTGDDSQPTLQGFNLDVGRGRLVLSFSEAVNTSSLDVTQIFLQSGPTANLSDHFLPLSGGDIEPNTTAAVVNVIFLQQDLDMIKEELGFGGDNTTFLAISEGAVLDPTGNALIGISQDAALNVSMAIIDQVPPQLVEFMLDLNSNTLYLTFDEVIDATMVGVSNIILQAGTSLIDVSYQLQSSTVSSGLIDNITSVLNISISVEDSNNIKSLRVLANNVLTHTSQCLQERFSIPVEIPLTVFPTLVQLQPLLSFQT